MAASLLPAVYPFPSSLMAKGETILGMAVSPSNSNVLLFTPFSVFVFHASRAKWTVAQSLFSVLLLGFQ